MTNPDHLSHYGIKGMKWGVRRKSTTPVRSGKTTYQKKPVQLSDAEIKRRIARMELEKKYTDLNSKPKSEGKKYAENLLKQTGTLIVGGTAGFFLQKALKSKFG